MVEADVAGQGGQKDRKALNMAARIWQLRGDKLELPCVKIKERNILGGKTAGQGHCDGKSWRVREMRQALIVLPVQCI